ncbi:rhodanese-like domain-containing protein [Reinekea marinisedimentorum]|uniref:Rhodanese-related sulfurtransferase n=1 Tax=Reinekea marinisedimentorum TaxID=230495 RepID=A0A4V2UK64_9GAMM|nr:rhodanese-like domain-containing protein [Reinekea marinisedimentorum]TCS43022.1 rhodanese-related sulfurtransferase [Reinekea marinisedimentorum]
MLEQLLEFVVNHWVLSLIWAVLLILLIKTEGARGGAAVSNAQATALINNENAKVLDIRSRDDFLAGHLPNAINIPSKDLQIRLSELNAYKDENLIIVCKSGTTAGAIGTILNKQGFTKLHKLRGGILEWKGNNLPLVKG